MTYRTDVTDGADGTDRTDPSEGESLTERGKITGFYLLMSFSAALKIYTNRTDMTYRTDGTDGTDGTDRTYGEDGTDHLVAQSLTERGEKTGQCLGE